MTAPDGRTFTVPEWVEYLHAHPDSTHEPYVCEDGKVFEIDGFRFNVHNVVRNPHRLMVGDHKIGYEIRTFRKWISLQDRRVVWWWQVYGYGANASGYGHMEPGDTEGDAILRAFDAAARSIQGCIDWYEAAIRKEKEYGYDCNMGYNANLARQKQALALTRQAYDEHVQLSLF